MMRNLDCEILGDMLQRIKDSDYEADFKELDEMLQIFSKNVSSCEFV